MRGKRAAVFIDELAPLQRDVGRNKRRKISFANKADALAVALVRCGQLAEGA
jgi:hypothetical protein